MKIDQYEFKMELTKELYDSIHEKASNRYSQFGEDGIVRFLTEMVGVTNKWCLEVGAADGIFCSNTRQFVHDGWTVVLLEKDDEEYMKLLKNATKNCITKQVSIEGNGENSIDEIMSKMSSPNDIELMSLDLDGGEYHIWSAMLKIRPKIMIIEHSRKATDDWYIPKYDSMESAGYKALIKLGSSKGYTLVDICGHNLIFVDKVFLKAKDKTETTSVSDKVRYNLGAGDVPFDGYINIDRKTGTEVYPLDCDDGTADEIRASHILEHFDFKKEAILAVENWFAKLKPGGVMKIAVPDFKKICQGYLNNEKLNTSMYLLGSHLDSDDYHKSMYDEKCLRQLMESVGLVDIKPWESEGKDCSALPISLNLQGMKPVEKIESEPTEKEPTEDGKVIRKVDCSKIGAVMSMPRLTFSDNMFCAMATLSRLGIEMRQGIGVFWGQIHSRCWQNLIDAGKEFIVTIDYDTYFTKEQFLYLYTMIVSNPKIDAIMPVQIKRESCAALAGLVKTEEVPKGTDHPPVSSKMFEQNLTKLVTGHFGLTILRVSALKKLSHPWFLGVPNKDGKWEEGRMDDDIYFWNHFHEEGFKLFQANRIGIGHMQLMVTTPDTLENGWTPVHNYITDIRKNGLPKHCLPDLEITKG